MIRNIVTRIQSWSFLRALREDVPMHEDVPALDAERWLGLVTGCEQKSRRIIDCPKARALLTEAAEWSQTVGFRQQIYKFEDGSKLFVGEYEERVLV